MLSRVSYLCCLGIMLYTSFFLYPRWGNEAATSTLGWDVSGYYWYLPSMFIYKDLKQQNFGDSLINKYPITPAFEQSYQHESGNRVNVYTAGMAIVYLPSFIIAHAMAKAGGYEADGFSLPYQVAIPIGCLLIVMIGLWYFRKLLLLYFEDKVAAVVLMLLVLGTNFLTYSTTDAALTHSVLFTIYVLLILSTHYFYQSPKTKYAAFIGLLCGLAVLIRPSEIVAFIIPVLWGMDSLSVNSIRKRFRLFIAEYKKMTVAAVCAILVIGIQVAYWLYITGQPMVYSYTNKGFSWVHPHTWDFLFSYRSGWLVYNPLMLLTLIGFIPFLIRGKNKVAVIVFFICNLYIISAWDEWWYSGVAGRPMMQSYAIILFPLATLVETALRKRLLLWLLSPFALLFIYCNIWFTVQAHIKGGHYDTTDMTKGYYWAVTGRWNVSNEVYKYRTTNEVFAGAPDDMQLVYSNDFETDTSIANNPEPFIISGRQSTYISGGQEYSTAGSFGLKPSNATWLRAKAVFQCKDKEGTAWKMPQFVIQILDDETLVKTSFIRIPYFIKGSQPAEIYLDIKLPSELFNKVKVFMWNPGSRYAVVMDNLEVWTFR